MARFLVHVLWKETSRSAQRSTDRAPASQRSRRNPRAAGPEPWRAAGGSLEGSRIGKAARPLPGTGAADSPCGPAAAPEARAPDGGARLHSQPRTRVFVAGLCGAATKGNGPRVPPERKTRSSGTSTRWVGEDSSVTRAGAPGEYGACGEVRPGKNTICSVLSFTRNVN